MFRKFEIKSMRKGFYPSRCGNAKNQVISDKKIICGSGNDPNRANRRIASGKNTTGQHRNKGGILKVFQTYKLRSRLQVVMPNVFWDRKKKEYVETPLKRIIHWELS